MALLFMESWDYLGATPEIKYTTTHSSYVDIETALGSRGGKALEAYSGDACIISPQQEVTSGVLGFAFRSKRRFSTSAEHIVSFYHRASLVFGLRMTHSGCLFLMDSSNSYATPGPSRFAILPEVWYYIEIKIVALSASSSPGDIVVRIDGVDVLTIDGGMDIIGTEVAAFDQIHFVGTPYGACQFDDIYLCDLTGAKNNDYLGALSVEALMPDGNGNQNDFTGSDSDSTDNYLHVDETTPDDDTSYAESSVIGDLDLYTFDNMATTPDLIHAVQVQARLKTDTLGLRTAKLVSRVNISNYEGVEQYVGPDYLHFQEIWENNPDDVAAWEEADVNGAEFGVKVQS